MLRLPEIIVHLALLGLIRLLLLGLQLSHLEDCVKVFGKNGKQFGKGGGMEPERDDDQQPGVVAGQHSYLDLAVPE